MPRSVLTWCLLPVLAVLATPTVSAHTELETQLDHVTHEIEHRPRDASLYVRRGNLRRRLQDWQRAKEDFDLAHVLGTSDVRDELRFHRARLFSDAGQPDQAIDELNSFIERHPRHLIALRTRALAYEQIGSFENAIVDLTTLIDCDEPQSPEPWLNRARLWIQSGDTDAAVASIDKALNIFGPLPVFVEFLVDAELDRESYAAALAVLDDLPDVLAASPRWLWRRGDILNRLGRSDDASRAFIQARQAIMRLPERRRNAPVMRDMLERSAAYGAIPE